jgi:hypothetical protein
MVYITALDVLATVAGEGRNVGVGASGSQSELASRDEIRIRELEIRGNWDGIEECSSMPTPKAEHASLMCRSARSVEVVLCEGVSNILHYLFPILQNGSWEGRPSEFDISWGGRRRGGCESGDFT